MMATFTDPMTLLLLGPGGPVNADRAVRVVTADGGGRPSRCLGSARRCLAGGAGLHCSPRFLAFGIDEFGQPADLAAHRLQAVTLQLEGVPSESRTGLRQCGPQPLALLLDGATPTLEDPQSHVRG